VLPQRLAGDQPERSLIYSGLRWRPKHDALQTVRETIAADRLDRFVR
jgi:hypothetical protein